jgi:methionine aminopeptidase
MKKNSPPKLRINPEPAAITKRARQAVEKIVASGVDHHDIARLCDTTVLSLLDGATPTLRRPQFMALATHFNVSLFWLWSGHGPEFINPN